MTVRIYTRPRNTIPNDSLLLWEGDISWIPRVGDYVTCWDGWCAEEVCNVYFDMTAGDISITLNTTDPNGEYEDELKKRKETP